MLSPQLLGKTEALIQSGLSLQTSVFEGSTELLTGNTGVLAGNSPVYKGV